MSFVDERHPFESTSEFFGISLDSPQRTRSQVVHRVLEGGDGEKVPVFFKLYGYRALKRRLARIFKDGRAKAEFSNLSFFRSLGIPACEPMLWGEYRTSLGLLQNCMIVTREVPDTIQLDQYIEGLRDTDEPTELKQQIHRQIIGQIAVNLKKIHDQHFFHDDLKWRNILVRRSGENAETFWIDCPSGYVDKTGGMRQKHGEVKDIATWEYLANRYFTAEEVMHFIKNYLGADASEQEAETLLSEVVAYRKRKLED